MVKKSELPLKLLNAEEITALLQDKNIPVEVLEKVDSTNDYLKKYIPNNQRIRICIAEYMTNGKGRLHRKWYAPFGKNIYFSLLYPFRENTSALSGLSLVVGLAVCCAIESTVQLTQTLSIKWPNDILVNQYKLSGILIETQLESCGSCQTIIGIGINVNMMEADKESVSQPWTSLAKITGQYIDRNVLCANLMNVLSNYLKNFKQYGLKFFIEEWQKRDCLFGKPIVLLSHSQQFQGTSAGIDVQGQLLLNMQDNTLRAFSSGDTTLFK